MSTTTGSAPLSPSQGLLTFSLVDADTDEIICFINPGDVIDPADYANRNVTISAEATGNGASIGSVELKLGGISRVENGNPYALFGDDNGDFSGTNGFTSGAQTLEIKVYSGANKSGTLLDSFQMPFTFGEDASAGVGGSGEPPVDPGTDADFLDPDALVNQFDHIFFHFDGNNNDPDDIAAMPMAAVLAKAGGIEDKITFLYGNNLAEANVAGRKALLDAGADFAASLGINAYDYQDGIDATTALLVQKLNSGEKILMIEGGPMEAVYRALALTDPANHSNITLVSHSSWNENRDVINNPSDPGLTEARTWSDIRSDFPAVTLIDIQDQNNGNHNDRGFFSYNWSWLDTTDDPVLQEARDIMEPAGTIKKNDPSDSGMLFYALTGDQGANPLDAKAFIESSPYFGDPVDPVDPGDPGDPGNPVDPVDPDSAYYQIIEENGGSRFKIQIEDAGTDPAGKWSYVEGPDSAGNQDGANGGYYVYGTPNPPLARNNVIQEEILTYRIYIPEGSEGVYNLRLRVSRDGKAESDKENDLWLNFQKADSTDSIADYLTGNTHPHPTSENYVKVFGGPNNGSWGYATKYEGSSAYPAIGLNITEPGFYDVLIAGRSEGYHIDFFELWNGSVQLGPNAADSQLVNDAPPDPNPVDPDPVDPDPVDPDPVDPDPVDPDPVDPNPVDPGNTEVTLAVIDPDTDQPVSALTDGMTIGLDDLNLTKLNIQATPASSVGSVVFTLDGAVIATENVAPYALFGDNSGDFAAGDISVGDHTLKVTLFSGTNGNGSIIGSDTIAFSVADTVIPANGAPVAQEDSAVTSSGESVYIDVLANDSDPDGDPLTIEIVDAPAEGTAVVTNNGITYTPAAGASAQAFSFAAASAQTSSFAAASAKTSSFAEASFQTAAASTTSTAETSLQTFTYRVIDDKNAASEPVTVTVTVTEPAPDPDPVPDPDPAEPQNPDNYLDLDITGGVLSDATSDPNSISAGQNVSFETIDGREAAVLNGDKVVVQPSEDFFGNKNYSLSFDLAFTGGGSSGGRVLNFSSSFVVFMGTTGMSVALSTDQGNTWLKAGYPELADNEWHSVTLTFNGETGVAALYLNGELLREVTGLEGQMQVGNASQDLRLGDPFSDKDLGVAFSDLKFLGYDLTAEEVASGVTGSDEGDVPADDVPADDVPADDAPADDAPADDVPADDVPADDTPADDVPADEVPDGGDDTADNVIYGTDGNDKIYAGSSEGETVDGGRGNDVIVTYGGDDALIGGEGSDSLIAGDGNDVLYGDADDARLDGGKGFDVLRFGEDAADIDMRLFKAYMQGVDAFDIEDGNNQTLTVDHRDADKVDAADGLFIFADKGDTVVFDDSKSYTSVEIVGQQEVDGNMFNVFKSNLYGWENQFYVDADANVFDAEGNSLSPNGSELFA